MGNFVRDAFDDEHEDKTPIFDEEQETFYNISDTEEDEGIDDDFISDIDFSEFRGDLKSSLKKIKHRVGSRKKKRRSPKPFTKEFDVKRHATLHGQKKQIQRVIVPNSKPVIVEGVSKFILSQQPDDDSAKSIGYYKGEKLEVITLHFNNANSATDFNLELFNPSMPLDYLYETSLNLNDKITVSGGLATSYSDVLFNLLANPTLIPNAKFVFAAPIGGDVRQQIQQPLIFKNKNIRGEQKLIPQQLPLKIDNLQFQSDMVYFDLMRSLNRPFIADGMDVIQYKVLAGFSVTFGFYFKQISLKKLLFKEAHDAKGLF